MNERLKRRMKISDISTDISPIYSILTMLDTISAIMTDISVLNRYIVEISGMWHTRALVYFFGKISEIYRDISEIYLNDQI